MRICMNPYVFILLVICELKTIWQKSRLKNIVNNLTEITVKALCSRSCHVFHNNKQFPFYNLILISGSIIFNLDSRIIVIYLFLVSHIM